MSPSVTLTPLTANEQYVLEEIEKAWNTAYFSQRFLPLNLILFICIWVLLCLSPAFVLLLRGNRETVTLNLWVLLVPPIVAWVIAWTVWFRPRIRRAMRRLEDLLQRPELPELRRKLDEMNTALDLLNKTPVVNGIFFGSTPYRFDTIRRYIES